MLVAQQLYEGVEIGKKGAQGLISYIRTDSVRVASEAQEAAKAYISATYGERYVPITPNIFKGRRNAQDAHEAIRPTSLENEPKAIKSFLSSDQYKLYKLVYERFVASQMADAQVLSSTVSFDANGCIFRSNGVRVLFDGFTAVYTEGRDEQQESEVQLPPMERGDRFTQSKITPEQRYTQAPPRYTEATLVKFLEEKGIGRPSTYSPIISTIVDRGYVAREKKTLMPTDLGFIVTRLMKDNFKDIVDVKFTSDMEDKLDGVEANTISWVELLDAFYKPFSESLQKAWDTIERVEIPDEVSDEVCDKCGAKMVYKMGRYGRFLACPNYPECKNTKPILEKIGVACPKCGGAILKKRSRKGKTFYGCEKYPACDFVSWDRPVEMRCPKCGGVMVKRVGQNGSYIACTNADCKYIYRNTKKSDDTE